VFEINPNATTSLSKIDASSENKQHVPSFFSARAVV